jgi:triosephosphate isomerase
MKIKTIVFNWKMNPKTFAEAEHIFLAVKKGASGLKHVKAIVAPPSIFLRELSRGYRGKSVSFAAQNIFWEGEGSHTGEISPVQVKDTGADYAIIGHAEQRARGVTDEEINRKVLAAIQFKLKPIVCISDTEHDSEGEYVNIVRHQIKTALKKVPPTRFRDVVVAYDPAWAIGAQEAPGVNSIHQMTLLVRKIILEAFGRDALKHIRVLYGGAVNAKNAEGILSIPDIDGVLVGRASLDAKELHALLLTANRV